MDWTEPRFNMILLDYTEPRFYKTEPEIKLKIDSTGFELNLNWK